MPQPNWNMKHWETGRSMTLLEAFGFSKFKFTFPQFNPELPNVAAQSQRPLQVAGMGSAGPVKGGQNLPKQKGALAQFSRKLLIQNGWSQQFGDFNALVMSESGWNPHIKNPSSGAYGIAQALGHGKGAATQGTESNNYGGFGLTDKQAKEANSGNGYWQLVWMMNYIKDRYGSPSNAWAFHQTHNSY